MFLLFHIGNDVVIQDEWVLAGAGQLGSCVSVAAMAWCPGLAGFAADVAVSLGQ